MRFLDKGKTAFLVFLFTLAVSIIALHVNKSPLMDLFFAMDGVLMSVALARLYAKYTRVRDKKRLVKVGNLVKNSYLYR